MPPAGARLPLLVLLAAAAAGCCGLQRSAGLRGLDRDTPERAFAFVRAAFVEDSTQDQYDSLHRDFRERHGLTAENYALGRSLSPGIFERTATMLGKAEIDGPVERSLAIRTPAGPRAAARLSLRTPEGAGVFVLVDEPLFRLVTTDPDAPVITGSVASIPGAVRVAGDRLEVRLEAVMDVVAPAPGAEVLRIEVHHDWLLYAVERLEGLEEFLGEVKKAADEAGPEPGPAAAPSNGGKPE